MENNKYKIEKINMPDGERRVVVTAPDGRSVAPPCGEDLLAVYNYKLSVGKGDDRAAQSLLAEVIDNEQPVTRLAAVARGEVSSVFCAPIKDAASEMRLSC